MRKLFILLIGILLLTCINASVTILPNPMNISVQIGESDTYEINITNMNNFKIKSFSFPQLESLGFKFPNMEIEPNSSKTFTFEVNTNKSHYGQIIEIVEFKFIVNLSEETTTHNIEISSNGFSPTYLAIRQGDTIIWKNIDDVSHNIYSTNFGEITIPINSESSYIFNDIGEINYYDLDYNIFTQFNGDIQVLSKTSEQTAHNPNYDFNWIVDLNSASNPTTLEIDNSNKNYTIEYNKYKKGLLTIKNNGSEIAENLKLSSNSNWISFEQNNFNVAIGDTEWIEYTIFPSLLNTDGTNKTYNVNLSIEGSNSKKEVIELKVFIPYKEISNALTSDQSVLEYLENYYCPLYPCSVFCQGISGEQCNSSGSIGRNSDTNLTTNISSIDLYNLIKDLSKMKDSLLRSDNEIKSLSKDYNIYLPELRELLNQSLSIQKENRQNETVRNRVFWIIVLTVIIAVSLFIIIIRINKSTYNKSLLGGFYKYKT